MTCPNCQHRFSVKLGALRKPGVTCPNCATEFETSEFAKGMDDVERSLKQFGKNITRRFGR